MTAVSIAMATFNGQRFIQRQLDSIAAQTQLPAELVVCDDGSEDDTLLIIEAFAKSAPFLVRVHKNETRLGYRANFMHSASLCRSELIAFSDQDDEWYAHKLEAMSKPFSDVEVLLGYHNADIVTHDGHKIGTLASRAAPRPIMEPLTLGPFWPVALGFTEVFRRSLLTLNDLWDNSNDHYDLKQPLAHDQWFFFLAAVFGKIAYLDEPLVAYRQHTENTFGWRKTSLRKSFQKHFRDRSDEYAYYAKAANSRASLLETAVRKLDDGWGKRAATAADYYRKVSWLLEQRNAVYTAETLGSRLHAFRSMLANSGYTRVLGLSHKSLIADICFGVLAGHFLRSSN